MTYHRQETEYSCGPASVRNCLVSMGHKHSERKIRRLCGSNKINGTNERQIRRAVKALDFRSKVLYVKSEDAFKQRITYNLRKGNKLIILTDNEGHWISVVDYRNKQLKVIDPQEKRVKKEFTPKELARWCRNFSKKNKQTYYYGIVIYNPSPN
jgi:ABC-type bacteriocin/lantibiotic exporter with double-glycine peptidase domain